MSIDELTSAALKLSAAARARLAEELLASLDALPTAKVEQFWLEEASRREAELDSGAARLQPADEVLARARARLG